MLRATTNAGQVVMDNAAGGIRGILTDSIGDPMPGEPVRIAGTSTETQTGVDGTFSFTGVGAGRWTVLRRPTPSPSPASNPRASRWTSPAPG